MKLTTPVPAPTRTVLRRSSGLTPHLRLPAKIPTAREVHAALVEGRFSLEALEQSRLFLHHQLAQAAAVPDRLPPLADLLTWMEAGVAEVGEKYHRYLADRAGGAPRQYFTSRAHALYFLRGVAPTKLVDGAWLYGLLGHWQDPRFLSLIQTYVEELGEGSPEQNHVVLYKKLLATNGCERWDNLSDEHFVQGAIQLSLAYQADHFLPEIIGYNLGYEQLPLHLLITAHELKELHLDPYYFTLHITVDNADCGHARKAVDAIAAAMPRAGDQDEFYARVQAGYRLNLLGASTSSVIESFDLDREMEELIRRKSAVGCQAHSDYRRVEGRTVNDWLSAPNAAGDLLAALTKEGILKRGQDPQKCPFWRMIQSEKARMFGVFSDYEKQVIYEWIAGPTDQKAGGENAALSDGTKEKLRCPHAASLGHGDFDSDVRSLREGLEKLDRDEAMARIIAMMSPANHHSPVGLEATKLFCEILK